VKINEVHIHGFGAWTGLKLPWLPEGLAVLYGPNEAGKTTLMQFIRSVFYGFSPDRRHYLPPVQGGRPGGSMTVTGPNGRFQIERYDDVGGEQVILTAADGTRHGEHLVKVLLCNTDEAVFNNVFAVELREMQELGTLGDTQAAELLYNLTAGLDRISLVEVMRELETSRNRLLDRDGKPCQVLQLLETREKLRQEIEELGQLMRRWQHLATQQGQLARELSRLQEEHKRLQREIRVIELAITLGPRWQQRAALDDQLAALGGASGMPEGAVSRLDRLKAQVEKHERRRDQLRADRRELGRQAAALSVNEALLRHAPRIEALSEQESWLSSLVDDVTASQRAIADAQGALAAEMNRLGFGAWSGNDALPALSSRTLGALRGPARAVARCRHLVTEARQNAAKAKENANALAGQIESALSARQQPDLAAAVESAGQLVSQLRRRQQIDQRQEQMTHYRSDLEEQRRRSSQRQLLPAAALWGFGAVFVFGVVLVLVSLVLTTPVIGPASWPMALLGLAGIIVAGLGKILMERSNANQLEACQKQLHMLELQVQQAEEERDVLDRQLPRTGAPLESRLEAAENDLAALEELMPLDTRRVTARQEAQAAAGRAAQAEQELAAARRRWRQALAALGLPDNLDLKQIRQLVQAADRMGHRHREINDRHAEMDRRRRELESLSSRIVQLAAEAGLPPAPGGAIERLKQLSAALADQKVLVERRDGLLRQARQLRQRQTRHETALERLRYRWRRLLRESGVEDEEQLRRLAAQVAQMRCLRDQRETVAREIAAAIEGWATEEDLSRQIQGDAPARREARLAELREQLELVQSRIAERLEQRGRVGEQLRVLAEDRRLAARKLDLAMVEKRLEDAIGRWQVLALTSRVLDDIRATYERQRQPETLQEASGYLDRFTCGRYRRVWTPLGERALRVEDAEGHNLPVEVLSRGTREQLFLSLRLALVSYFARHGAGLPLVLDDVLVNFDAERAKAAATVLRDFAAAGHQLLVFTCHEHLMRLFKSLKVATASLPGNSTGRPVEVLFAETPATRAPQPARTPAPRKPGKKKRPRPEPEEDLEPIVNELEIVVEPEPVVEDAEDEEEPDPAAENVEVDQEEDLFASPDEEEAAWEEEDSEEASFDDEDEEGQSWEEEDLEGFGDDPDPDEDDAQAA